MVLNFGIISFCVNGRSDNMQFWYWCARNVNGTRFGTIRNLVSQMCLNLVRKSILGNGLVEDGGFGTFPVWVNRRSW